MKKQISAKIVSLIFGVLVMLFACSFYIFAAWQEPATAPPDGNVAAPLNQSNVGQSKEGGLVLNTGGATFGLIVDKGNVGIGRSSPAFPLDVNGKIGINGQQVIYLPDQTNFNGTLVIGNGGGNLTHINSWDGAGNTFVGIGVGNNITTGYENSIVGNVAFYSNTEGSQNSALGDLALYSNTTGFANVAIGSITLRNNTSGSWNSAVGMNAMVENINGSSNSAIGGQSLYRNTAGSENAAMGAQALYSNTTGNKNSALGKRALYSNIGGSNNIAVGFMAGDNITSGGNNIIMGYNIDAPLPTGNNQLSIGNLIFGTGINGEGTTISTGNIGIGTNNPQSKLQVVGNYIQFPTISQTAPAAADCDSAAEAGRVVVRTDGAINLYICRGAAGWLTK